MREGQYMEFVIINVPHFLGEKNPKRIETELIKGTAFIQSLNAPWVDVQPSTGYDDPVVALNVALAQAVADHAERFPIILSGDCVNCIGAVRGLKQRHESLGVVWYDAHGDFNTPETTPSGFLGGMPLAALVGRGNQHLLEGVELDPLPESMIVISDVRDLDPQEGNNLRESEIGVLEAVSMLETHPLPNAPLYVHLDVDILDPQYMPGLGYPAPNGPDVETVKRSLERIGRDAEIAGLLVSLWSTELAPNDETALDNTIQMMQALIEILQEKV